MASERQKLIEDSIVNSIASFFCFRNLKIEGVLCVSVDGNENHMVLKLNKIVEYTSSLKFDSGISNGVSDLPKNGAVTSLDGVDHHSSTPKMQPADLSGEVQISHEFSKKKSSDSEDGYSERLNSENAFLNSNSTESSHLDNTTNCDTNKDPSDSLNSLSSSIFTEPSPSDPKAWFWKNGRKRKQADDYASQYPHMLEAYTLEDGKRGVRCKVCSISINIGTNASTRIKEHLQTVKHARAAGVIYGKLVRLSEKTQPRTNIRLNTPPSASTTTQSSLNTSSSDTTVDKSSQNSPANVEPSDSATTFQYNCSNSAPETDSKRFNIPAPSVIVNPSSDLITLDTDFSSQFSTRNREPSDTADPNGVNVGGGVVFPGMLGM